MTATYAQARSDLIQAFTPRAKAFAELIRNRHKMSWSQNRTNIKRYHPTKMDFNNISDTFPVHHAEFTTSEIPGGGEGIKIWYNPWCFVAFYDIRPRAGASAKVHRAPAIILRKNVIGAGRENLENNTDDEQPMRALFKSVKSSGGSLNIGAKASSSFRQVIKAGGDAIGFESETELSASIEASTDIGNWHSEELADEKEWNGIVPAHTRRIVSRLVEVGRYQQQVTIDGELDYSIYVLSRGDFDVNFDGRDDVAAVLSGVGNTGKGGHYSDWARAYSAWPIPAQHLQGTIDAIAGPVFARVIEFDESDQATDTRFTWDDEKLD